MEAGLVWHYRFQLVGSVCRPLNFWRFGHALLSLRMNDSRRFDILSRIL